MRKASIIIPCKGKINLENFANQKYEDYEIIRKKIMLNDRIFVEISEKYKECSGKNSALLTGIKKLKGTYLFLHGEVLKEKGYKIKFVPGLILIFINPLVGFLFLQYIMRFYALWCLS